MTERPADWAIRPGEGVGPVDLGTDRRTVERALGLVSEPIDKGDPLPVAAFSTIVLHAHFDAAGRCEAVELMPPSDPRIDGRPLLGVPFTTAVETLRAGDPDVVVEIDGATSELLGTGLYAPTSADDPSVPAEGVIVFRPGYYDEL